MLLVAIRTLILYSLVVIVMRIMGKRQIGQLQPYELVIAIMIAELASAPMENTGVPLVNGVLPIILLLASQVTLSYLNLKSEKARSIICGKPSVLIENGKIIEPELRKLRYNINELLEQLRAKNYYNLGDVGFAILETSGQLSVIPKSPKRPLCPEDFQITTKPEQLPITLILDGKINEENLHTIGQDIPWLKSQLSQKGVQDTSDILIALLDSQGQLFFQKKQRLENL